MSDQQISTFIELTGAAAEQAERYLAVCDHDVENAVALFWENGGESLAASASPPPPARTTATETVVQEIIPEATRIERTPSPPIMRNFMEDEVHDERRSTEAIANMIFKYDLIGYITFNNNN